MKRSKSVVSRVLVVGQIPPPWGGQAVMIQKLLDSDLAGVALHFVPMTFSADMDEIGRFRWKKLFQLPVLVGKIWVARFKTGCNILYYPPGGESFTAICRDVFVLVCCRILFEKTIFHVHAGGFTDVAEATPWPVRKLAALGYRKPDVVIQLTEKSPPDAKRIYARKVVSVPNGLADAAAGLELLSSRSSSSSVQLLFVGVVGPSKGVQVLLNACAELLHRSIEFSISIVGRFYSSEFERECRDFVKQHLLEERIDFTGVQVAEDKWALFKKSDIFCFPTHFESENQSLVILEAMQFGLPCVASDWRGISCMVEDGKNGFLVPIQDPVALADKVEWLARNPEERLKMGECSRQKFLQQFTEEKWEQNMNKVLENV
ncbi:glycosyltransferase family 4 protein [Pontiellaceae bacterium B12219]|nr:glycosyltransferase family 4 protein [Pontiellaceae bacterium B12219]